MEQNVKKATPASIRIIDAELKGVYSNAAQIAHTKEEFVIDFAVALPPQAIVTSRVIVSPGHFKRMLQAMSNNLGLYEKAFGSIDVAEEPQGIGFKRS